LRTQKLPQALVNEILRRGVSEDAATIAHELNLRRLEVVAILSHSKIEAEARRRDTDEVEPQRDTDLWEKPPEIVEEPPERSSSQVRPHSQEGVSKDTTNDGAKGIYLGEELEYSAPVVWSPADSQAVYNPHLMIMGESGSGKTYAVQCIVTELAKAGMSSIIFDYGQGFEDEKLDPSFVKFCNPQQYLIGEQGLGLNPFQIFPQDARGPSSVATRLADAFDAAFHLGDIQKRAFIDAVLRAYGKAGITTPDRQTWTRPLPTLSTLNSSIEELAADRDYPNYRNAVTLSARLTTFFMLVSIHEQQWSWDKLINDSAMRVHVLQFRGLEGKTRRVMVELLLWHMFFYFKSHNRQGSRVFCILDEAHHLSFREGGPIDSLLREARKFGLGIVFASQQPEDFSPVAYSNTASKLIFQTADPDSKVSKFLASKSQNYDDPAEIRDIISSLPQGRALFITKNRAQTISVSDFPKRATQWGS